jgi:hypothetical protein
MGRQDAIVFKDGFIALNAGIGRAYPFPLRAVAMDEEEPSGVMVEERCQDQPM